MSLRSQRLAQTLDPAAAAYLASVSEDATLVGADILGTAAHVAGLVDANVLSAQEGKTLRHVLAQAHQEATAGRFPLDPALEDVHMNLEAWITQRAGDLGKRVHTARSRNDQVALDLRLAARAHTLGVATDALDLLDALQALGDKAPDAVLPGYTHLQPAQPVSLAHWTGAHIERILRDLGRLRDAYARINTSPLGAAALAGTGFPIDPAATAQRLGFDAAFRNSLDAVSDRDFLIELESAHALLAVHASQLAEDVILYANPSFGFFALADAWATGSSIMPQKKNPDVFEVVRGQAATHIGTLTALLSAAKGLPLAYNRDLQEQKRVALSGWHRFRLMLGALSGAVASLEPQPERMQQAAAQGFSDATEVADALVRTGMPFREAHSAAARLVRKAVEAGTDLQGLDAKAVAEATGAKAEDLAGILGPEAALAAKTSLGGAAPAALAAQREGQARERDDLEAFFTTEATRVAHAESALLSPPKQEATA